MYVAQVWSLTNKYAEYPYLVSRNEKRGKFEWKCTCPYNVNKRRSCKHITAVMDAVKTGTSNDNVKFLVDIDILK